MADEPKKKGSVLKQFFPGAMGDEPDGDEAGAPPGDADFDQACSEMMAAIKAGDSQGFCDALKAAIDMRVAGGGEPDGDEG